MVITAVMLILMMVTVALGVTAASRRMTARYAYTIGLYDLAVSGNEQALFLLRQQCNNQYSNVHNQAWELLINGSPIEFVLTDEGLHLNEEAAGRFEQFFVTEAMPGIRDYIISTYTRVRRNLLDYYRFTWDFEIGLDTPLHENTLTSFYSVFTDLRPANNRIYTHTRVERHYSERYRPRADVRATINWAVSGYTKIALDAHTIDTLGEQGAVFPVTTYPGMILILDEFALTMVESLRVDG